MRLAIILMVLPSLAAGQVPLMPEAEPAPYTSPRRLIDGLSLPAGNVGVEDGRVVYDSHAHLRLTIALDLAERLSDDRAAASWRRGWVRGVADLLGTAQEDRRARFVAEARVEALAAQLKAADVKGGWAWLEALGWAGLGIAVGTVATAAVAWSLQ